MGRMQEITLGGRTRKVYTPLYGTIGYLVEEIERMLEAQEGPTTDYAKGYKDALKEVLKLAKQMRK